MSDYEELRPYATTDSQRRTLDALKGKSQRQAAADLGVTRGAVCDTLHLLKRKRERAENAHKGVVPEWGMRTELADGYYMGKATLHLDAEGRIKESWPRVMEDKDRKQELLLSRLESALASHRCPKIRKPTGKSSSGLLTLYPIGDPHIGLYAWEEEAGEDVDSDKTQACLLAAADYLVDYAPQTEEAWILNLGDLFHADSTDNETRRSGANLDTDTRWARVLDIGIDTMLRVVYRALQKHKRVVVRNVIGNHDDHTSVVLSKAMDLFYRNNPRVIIERRPDFFWYRRFGKVLIGSTHGDQCKPEQLPGIMAHDVPEMWGQTLCRYWHTGHIHHDSMKEFPGCTWRSHRSMVGKDAYHARAGYRSGRSMSFYTYDAEYGEDESKTFDVRRFRQ